MNFIADGLKSDGERMKEKAGAGVDSWRLSVNLFSFEILNVTSYALLPHRRSESATSM